MKDFALLAKTPRKNAYHANQDHISTILHVYSAQQTALPVYQETNALRAPHNSTSIMVYVYLARHPALIVRQLKSAIPVLKEPTLDRKAYV